MSVWIGKLLWAAGVIAWFVIRYPHQRRNSHVPKLRAVAPGLEKVLMTVSALGLGVIPGVYVVSGAPRFADHAFEFWQLIVGLGLFAAALWLFRQTHKALGKFWSVTLELRQEHQLITNGIYGLVRHPMYSAFWLWALAQAFLLPNWVAGLSGLIGFGALYLVRVPREERMLVDLFGETYRDYMKRTKRVVPYLI